MDGESRNENGVVDDEKADTRGDRNMNQCYERLIELMKDDKELHDAAVRMMNAMSEQTEFSNRIRREKYEQSKKDMSR